LTPRCAAPPQAVIEKERQGEYLGKTVQVVPHITDMVQDWIARVARIPVDGTEGEPDVCVIELGGTVGARPPRSALQPRRAYAAGR
jgi:CTP synthase (UTP-ammonia lyase)